MQPRFFESPAKFRAWLEKNHETAAEVIVGYFKRHTGTPSLTWAESVDEALCFGWIDGVRHSLDAERYTIRFTPRRPRSIWSSVNTKRVAELKALGRMMPAGLRAFEARDPKRSGIYGHERTPMAFDAASARAFGANARAKRFFDDQPPGYRRIVTYWVMSAKKEDTRQRRLAQLIDLCTRGKRLDFMRPARMR